MTALSVVNQERERFIIYAIHQGWLVYDKDTKTMIYNPDRLDGLYDNQLAAYTAAMKVQS